MGGMVLILRYSFRQHTSHTVCSGFGQGPWLFSNMASDWLMGDRFTAAEINTSKIADDGNKWTKLQLCIPPTFETQTFQLRKNIYYSHNHNVYNQLRKLAHLNCNLGSVYVHSYLSPEQLYPRPWWNLRVTHASQPVFHLRSMHAGKM